MSNSAKGDPIKTKGEESSSKKVSRESSDRTSKSAAYNAAKPSSPQRRSTTLNASAESKPSVSYSKAPPRPAAASAPVPGRAGKNAAPPDPGKRVAGGTWSGTVRSLKAQGLGILKYDNGDQYEGVCKVKMPQ